MRIEAASRVAPTSHGLTEEDPAGSRRASRVVVVYEISHIFQSRDRLPNTGEGSNMRIGTLFQEVGNLSG